MSTPRDDDLRDLLRAGDPHQGERLDDVTAVRIRARMLDAARPASSRRARRVPVLAAATATVAVALLAVWLWETPVPAIREAPAPEALAPRFEPAMQAPEILVPRFEPATRAPDLVGPSAPALPASAPVAPAVVADGASAPAVATVVAESGPQTAAATREARHLRFTAPGGTRIIWTLDPDFEASVVRAGASSRSPEPEPQQGDDAR